jgi:DNA-binding GntR family transcriptional regulator
VLRPRARGPGAKLSLHELATELGVSRSPVHHALTRLVSEGLLSVKARRGYYVTPVTAKALVDGYDVRLALELHAAECTVGSVDRPKLERFRALMVESEAAISQEEWDAANAAFHEFQIDLAGNEMLSQFYRELSVNLMMQVIRGGRLEGGEYLARSIARSSMPSTRRSRSGAAGDQDAHRVGEGHRARRDRPLRRPSLAHASRLQVGARSGRVGATRPARRL